jgi:hypothetical protein
MLNATSVHPGDKHFTNDVALERIVLFAEGPRVYFLQQPMLGMSLATATGAFTNTIEPVKNVAGVHSNST